MFEHFATAHCPPLQRRNRCCHCDRKVDPKYLGAIYEFRKINFQESDENEKDAQSSANYPAHSTLAAEVRGQFADGTVV
jgi:hypothetical protein